MKITFEQYDIKATIEHIRDDLTLEECINDLIVPMLLAAGYSYESIKERLLDDDDEDQWN